MVNHCANGPLQVMSIFRGLSVQVRVKVRVRVRGKGEFAFTSVLGVDLLSDSDFASIFIFIEQYFSCLCVYIGVNVSNANHTFACWALILT